jgi:predicted kinase
MEPITTTGARPVRVPEALFVMIGPPGSGKSRLAAKMVANGLEPDAVVSADALRALPQFGGNVNDSTNNPAVFAHANRTLDIRLRSGVPVLFDATGLHAGSRLRQIEQARRTHMPTVALLARQRSVDELASRCSDPERGREVDRLTLAASVERHALITAELLLSEGFDRVIVFDDATEIQVLPSTGDWKHVTGPFAVISDVHNCLNTLQNLLRTLGFDENLDHPDGLFPILDGDVVNKGGRLPGDHNVEPADYDAALCLRWILEKHRQGKIGWVLGNNEVALLQTLTCEPDQALSSNSLDTAEALRAQPDATELIAEFRSATLRLPAIVEVNEHGETVYIAHAGYRSDINELPPVTARRFALYANESWTKKWEGSGTVVYGHVLQESGPRVINNDAGGSTVGIETGAYLGGGMSAYRTDTKSVTTEPSVPHDIATPERIGKYQAYARLRAEAKTARRLLKVTA